MHDGIEGFHMPSGASVNAAAETFRLLSDPTRIRILLALLQGETSVACLAELAGTTTPAVSQHLAKLRMAGVVRGRREGTFVFYTVEDVRLRRLLVMSLPDIVVGDSRTRSN